jgi:hypothetical protein
MQPHNRLNKRQARYMRDLQPFVSSMTLAYRKGALNEADPLSRRPDFVPLAKVVLGWRASVRRRITTEVQAHVRLLEDAPLNVMVVRALRLSHEFDDVIREGYSQDSYYGDEGEWTKNSRIEVCPSIAFVSRGTLSSD